VEERARLERRAKLLAWTGNGWHLVEFAVALAAGIAAGSVALVGFGLDSLIEVAAAGVVIWLFSGGRGSSHTSERRAQQMIAASYALLVAYISVEAVRDLLGGNHPAVSWLGIGLAAVTAPTMPLLARTKAQPRPAAELSGHGLRSRTEHGLRLSLGRAADRAAAERTGGLVVGRPRRRARDRRTRRQGGPRQLAR
jgi:hypothetical protein